MLYVYVPGAYVKLQAFNVFGNGTTGAVDGGTESRETGFVGGTFTGAGDPTEFHYRTLKREVPPAYKPGSVRQFFRVT